MDQNIFVQKTKLISSTLWKEYYLQRNLEQAVPEPKISQLEVKTNAALKKIIFIEYESIPSTMIPSENWPRQTINASDIYCFIAKEQRDGVGQKSNKWISPRGNVYVTLLTRYNLHQLKNLAVKVNNSIAKTLMCYCLNPKTIKCKWVNDIFINDKKVSGALIKNQAFASETAYGISQIGIGVNVSKSPSQEFTSLAEHSKSSVDLSVFTKELIINAIQRLFNQKSFSEELKFYETNLLYLKEEVCIYNSQMTEKLHEGLFVGINEYGHALLEINGVVQPISDGRMRPLLKPSFKPLNVREIMKQL